MEYTSTTPEGFYIVSGHQEVSQNTPFQARPLRRCWLWVKLWQCAALLNILWMEMALYKFQLISLLCFNFYSSEDYKKVIAEDEEMGLLAAYCTPWYYCGSSFNVLGAPMESAYIKLHTIIWTFNPYVCILQNADTIASHSTSIRKN